MRYDEDLTDHDLEMIWFTGDLYGPCLRCWCRIRFSHSPATLAMGLWPALVAWKQQAGARQCQSQVVPRSHLSPLMASGTNLGALGYPIFDRPFWSRIFQNSIHLTRVSHLVSSGLKPASQPHGTPWYPMLPMTPSPGSTSTPRPSSLQISWSP